MHLALFLFLTCDIMNLESASLCHNPFESERDKSLGEMMSYAENTPKD